MSSLNFFPFPRCSCRVAPPATATVSHRSPRQPLQPQSVKRPTLLLIAGSDLLPHLAEFLGTHGYTIYVATETSAVQAILASAPIDLLLLHCAPELSYGGWETYTQLRQWTTKPVMMVANITVEHFTLNFTITDRKEMENEVMENEEMENEETNSRKRNADLTGYLHTIDLFCHTMLPQLG